MKRDLDLQKLPLNWKVAELGDMLNRITNGLTATQHIDPPGLPVTRIETISYGAIDFNRVRYVRDIDNDKKERFLLKRGDILFSHINSDLHLGKTAVVSTDKPLLHGMNLLLLRTNNELLDSYYLHYLLNYYRYSGKFIEVAQHAVNQSSLNQKKIKSLQIPLAPVPIQKLIVSEIEKQFSRLDEAVAALKRVRASLKRYKASVLKAAVEGNLTEEWRKENVGAGPCACPDSNKGQPKVEGQPQGVAPTETGAELPDGWQCTKLAEVAEINPKLPKNIPDNVEVSFLPMKLVQEETGRIDLSITKKFKEVKRGYTSFINNDIIFAKITPCMENGKIAIVENLRNGLGFGSTEFHVIRSHEPKSIKYLFYFLLQRDIRKQAQRNMTGTAGQLRVPTKFMQEISVSLPPISEQQKVVEEIESCLSVAEEIEETIDINLKRAERLRQAILKKAFEGKLI